MKKKTIRLRGVTKAVVIAAGCIAMSAAMVMQSGDMAVNAMTKEEAEEQKKEAKENEDSAKSVLEAMEKEQNKIIQDVENLDSQVTVIQVQISSKEDEAKELQTEIDSTQKKLEKAQKAEDDQYSAMKQRIQYLYEEGDIEYVEALLTSVSFSDMLNKSEYIDQISEYDQNQLAQLIDTKTKIADYESSLESDLRQVESLRTDLETAKANLQDLIDQKQQEITKYDDDIDAQKSLMAKFTAKREEAEARIAEISRQEALKARSNGTTPAYTKDGKVYDTSKYAGRFMWPVATGGVITDEFGYRDAPTVGASTYHQGLDIGCDYGTDILAADDGTVVMSCYNGGGGNMVMISHEDGICTVYMHNSQLCVNVGETVVKGQVIAKAGSTGISTGPHCHFGVSIDGTYVNPHDFLKE